MWTSQTDRDRQRLDLINSGPSPTSRSATEVCDEVWAESVLQDVELGADWGPAEYLDWQPARLVILQLGQTLQCIYILTLLMVGPHQTLKQIPAQIKIILHNIIIQCYSTERHTLVQCCVGVLDPWGPRAHVRGKWKENRLSRKMAILVKNTFSPGFCWYFDKR